MSTVWIGILRGPLRHYTARSYCTVQNSCVVSSLQQLILEEECCNSVRALALNENCSDCFRKKYLR